MRASIQSFLFSGVVLAGQAAEDCDETGQAVPAVPVVAIQQKVAISTSTAIATPTNVNFLSKIPGIAAGLVQLADNKIDSEMEDAKSWFNDMIAPTPSMARTSIANQILLASIVPTPVLESLFDNVYDALPTSFLTFFDDDDKEGEEANLLSGTTLSTVTLYSSFASAATIEAQRFLVLATSDFYAESSATADSFILTSTISVPLALETPAPTELLTTEVLDSTTTTLLDLTTSTVDTASNAVTTSITSVIDTTDSNSDQDVYTEDDSGSATVTLESEATATFTSDILATATPVEAQVLVVASDDAEDADSGDSFSSFELPTETDSASVQTEEADLSASTDETAEQTINDWASPTATPAFPLDVKVPMPIAPIASASFPAGCDDALLMRPWNGTLLPPPIYYNDSRCIGTPTTASVVTLRSTAITSTMVRGTTATSEAVATTTRRAGTTLVVSTGFAGQIKQMPFVQLGAIIVVFLTIH